MPYRLTPFDLERLGGQTRAIVDRLREGPATSSELAEISLKYTSRTDDARLFGFEIDCVRGSSGQGIYTLTGYSPKDPKEERRKRAAKRSAPGASDCCLGPPSAPGEAGSGPGALRPAQRGQGALFTPAEAKTW